MAAAFQKLFKISAKDNATVTLVPVDGGKPSANDLGREITQIVITATSITAADDRYFDPLNRVIAISFERK